MTVIELLVLLLIVILVAAVAVALVLVSRRRRRSEELRTTFGPEYDRTLEHAENRRAAERELAERQQRHAQLEIRPLPPGSRQRYLEAWGRVQSRFVDQPVLALTEADALVTRLMAERGFPTDGPDEQAAMLSVQHRHVLDSFRAGHAIEERNSTRSADTEQVRQGMLHFRAVFEGLIDDGTADERVQAEPEPQAVRVERADRDEALAESRLADGRPAVVVRDSTAPAGSGEQHGPGQHGSEQRAPGQPPTQEEGALRPIVLPPSDGNGDGRPAHGGDADRR